MFNSNVGFLSFVNRFANNVPNLLADRRVQFVLFLGLAYITYTNADVVGKYSVSDNSQFPKMTDEQQAVVDAAQKTLGGMFHTCSEMIASDKMCRFFGSRSTAQVLGDFRTTLSSLYDQVKNDHCTDPDACAIQSAGAEKIQAFVNDPSVLLPSVDMTGPCNDFVKSTHALVKAGLYQACQDFTNHPVVKAMIDAAEPFYQGGVTLTKK